MSLSYFRLNCMNKIVILMIKPKIPSNEQERLKDLESYSILDTLPENEFDEITLIASQICSTPISLISLVDEKRQWFKSHHGLDATQTPREVAFCAHAINDSENVFTIPDSRLDERFHDNPLVIGKPNVIFYTGVPLVSSKGNALGTLCVIDNKPKQLDDSQIKSLSALAAQVVRLFELRKNKRLLENTKNELELKNKELEQFAHVAAHDIKSPLNNITSLTELLVNEYSSSFDEEIAQLFNLLNSSSGKLRNLVDGILEHSKSDKILLQNRELISVKTIIEEVILLIGSQKEYEFLYPMNNTPIHINKTALEQILINLISNGVKYNDKEKIVIEIDFEELDKFYRFYVRDNGCGIRDDDKERIFKIFEVLEMNDRFGRRGNGIGLSTVKKLVEGQSGEIKIESERGKGTKFEFTIAK